MKLFKSLLVAPATLGLLAPMAASANEVTINDFNAAEEIAVTNSRIDGLEARFNNLEAGSFSETTTASFGFDFLVGAVDGGTSEQTEFAYSGGIGQYHLSRQILFVQMYHHQQHQQENQIRRMQLLFLRMNQLQDY